MTRRPLQLRFAMPLVVSACLLGCVRERVFLIPPGEPVQLAEDVKARIFLDLPDGTRIPSKDRTILHAGQWVVTDDETDSQH